jgi:hypothetical protein
MLTDMFYILRISVLFQQMQFPKKNTKSFPVVILIHMQYKYLRFLVCKQFTIFYFLWNNENRI